MEISFPFTAVLVLNVVQQLLPATGGRGSSTTHVPAFYTYQDTVIVVSHRSVVSRPAAEYTAAKKTFVLSLFFW